MAEQSACGRTEPATNAPCGWVPTATACVFDRDSLRDYLAGSGDLYLAYDFRELHVQEYHCPEGAQATVERYEMGTPADACGLFLHEWRGGNAGLGQGSECGAGLLRFWKGPRFVRVLASSDVQAISLGRTLAESMEECGAPSHLLSHLPPQDMVAGTQRYFHEWTVLNHFCFLATDNLLCLSQGTDCVLAEYATPAAKAKLLIVHYPARRECLRGWDRFQRELLPERAPTSSAFCYPIEAGEWIAGRCGERETALALEATSGSLASQLVEAVESLADA